MPPELENASVSTVHPGRALARKKRASDAAMVIQTLKHEDNAKQSTTQEGLEGLGTTIFTRPNEPVLSCSSKRNIRRAASTTSRARSKSIDR